MGQWGSRAVGQWAVGSGRWAVGRWGGGAVAGWKKRKKAGRLRLVARPASKSFLTFALTDFDALIRCFLRRIMILRDHLLPWRVSFTYALASCRLRRRDSVHKL